MRVLFFIIAAILLALVGCSGQAAEKAVKASTGSESGKPAEGSDNKGSLNVKEKNSKGYKKITPDEAKRMLDAGSGAILVDVRTRQEYDEKHIPGSILIPVDVIGKEAEKLLPDKDAQILIYCRSGRRSAIAAEELARLGYGNVYDFGGIMDWRYETEK